MYQANRSFRSFWWLLAVLLWIGAIPAHGDDPPEGDTVTVVVDGTPLRVPPAFQRQLRNRGFSRLAFADASSRLHLFESNGRPVNLCGTAGATQCSIHTDALGLVMLFSAAGSCGSCNDGGFARVCRKALGQDYWPCSNPKYNAAHACDTNCGP